MVSLFLQNTKQSIATCTSLTTTIYTFSDGRKHHCRPQTTTIQLFDGLHDRPEKGRRKKI